MSDACGVWKTQGGMQLHAVRNALQAFQAVLLESVTVKCHSQLVGMGKSASKISIF